MPPRRRTAPTIETPGELTIGSLARAAGVRRRRVWTWEQELSLLSPSRRPLDWAAGTASLPAPVVVAQPAEGTPSVYQALRRRHPTVAAHTMKKSTLVALSFAIEDEFCARAEGAHLFGGFQDEQFWRPAEATWELLSRTAARTYVLASFGDEGPPPVRAGGAAEADPEALTLVHLGPGAAMHREWVVVCDAPDLSVVLAAWEHPDQDDLPDRDRAFETVWTVNRQAVRDAAHVCATVALEHGAAGAAASRALLAEPAPDRQITTGDFNALVTRMMRYADGEEWRRRAFLWGSGTLSAPDDGGDDVLVRGVDARAGVVAQEDAGQQQGAADQDEEPDDDEDDPEATWHVEPR